MNNVEKKFFPEQKVTIDEQLFHCRARCSFIQYMPPKPAKFGIKYWILCDVKSSYALRAMPNIGREDWPQVGVAKHVVMSLMEPYHKTEQNVTTDNYFTSLKTVKNLLQHNITKVGTLRKNKKAIPAELHVDTRQQPLYTSGFFFTQENSIVLLYYKAKQKKYVFLLSSMHTTPVVNDHGVKKKPEAILY